MLYYISILLVLIGLLLFQYFAFLRIYYIGQALHKFRELRNEVTLFLSANVKENLSLPEAVEYQQFLHHIDAIIKHFNKIKTRFTQFRSVKVIYLNIIFSAQKINVQSEESITNLNYYKTKACEGVLTAFKAIPFCRPRLIFLKVLALVSFTLGFDKYSKELEYIQRLSKIEKDMLNQNSMPCN